MLHFTSKLEGDGGGYKATNDGGTGLLDCDGQGRLGMQAMEGGSNYDGNGND